MANRNEAHTALISATLIELAKAGYCAWGNSTGVWFSADGRPHKFGKKGSGDICCVLPPHGRHAEFEGKTGTGKQNENQKRHQKYVVERNGGLYIGFHSPDELLTALRAAGY